MKIAFVKAPGRGDVDLLLSAVADRLAAEGMRLVGTVQTNLDRPGGGPCDMDVRVLPDGPVLRISQYRGAAARGCRLDPEALEQAVALSTAALDRGAEALLVNKFGKHEAEGRGFRGLIAEALSRGLPVLCGLNDLNAAAFAEFAGGLAQELPNDAAALAAWVRDAARAETLCA